MILSTPLTCCALMSSVQPAGVCRLDLSFGGREHGAEYASYYSMELSDALSFLGAHQHGVLTTLKRDGRPQLSNIVYSLGEDGVIRVSVTDSRAKTANLRRDPRASLHVTQDDFWAFAVVEAHAELSPVAADPNDATVDDLIDLYCAVAGEHDDWDEYRRAMVADERLVVRLTPEHAYGMIPG